MNVHPKAMKKICENVKEKSDSDLGADKFVSIVAG